MALIVAPPGYGKTTLLAEWAEMDERPFIWLAPAEREFNIPRLVARRELARLPELVRAIRERHEQFVVVLDDAHWIDRASLSTILQATLNELPRGSTIALSARTEPPVPTGRLRAHQVVTEVRTSQLAMSAAEAARLLEAEAIKLAPGEIDDLVRRTEGWPAVLYLAGLSLRDDPDACARFDGHNRLVLEFIRDEVLSALPHELSRFAVRSSVLETLSAPACDALLERDGSGRVLEDLARCSPLLEAVDATARAYRWHPLVRDALHSALSLNTDDELALHGRAAAWYSGRGEVRLAIEHAVGAGDSALAGELISDHIVEFVMSGGSGLVRRWLAAFPDEIVHANASLALSASTCSLFGGDANEAQRWLEAASALCREGSTGCPSIVLGIAVLRAMTAPHGIKEMAAIGPSPGDAELVDSQWHSLSLLVHGVARHLQGDRGAGDDLLEEACRLSGETAPALASLGLAQRGMIAMEQGEWDLAGEYTDRALLVCEEWGLTHEPISALVYAAAAASRAHHGRIDEAKRDLRRGADLAAALGDFVAWYATEVRMLLAHASVWLADVVGARTLLAEASRFARRTPEATTFARWFDDAWAYMDGLAETKLAGPSSLTIAELRILRFMPSHRSFREIATQLGVSANTVKTQAHAVYRKLGAASRSEAVQCAIDAGLLGQ